MTTVNPVQIAGLSSRFIVKPGNSVKLSQINPSYTEGLNEDNVKEALKENAKKISDLQHVLSAESKQSLLIILQGMDTSGKNGTIRHVMSRINPQGCEVTAFNVPCREEASHDFLWRIHQNIPPKGSIGIFHRSQYEDVLVPRIKRLVPVNIWKTRYEQINNFEKMLSENGVTILKFFLHISKQEQKRRLIERITIPKKQWKLNPSDIKEREYWDKYKRAYEDVLNKCSTEWAPWYVIPSNNKWFRNFAISQIVAEAMEKMNMQYPEASIDMSEIEIQ